MATTTIIHKITNAVAKIGLANGTKMTEPTYGGEEKSNSARESWFHEWAIMAEYTIAKTISSIGAKREENAKALLLKTFADKLAKLTIGSTESIVRGNVTVMFNKRNGQRRINRQAVINVLTVAPYNWKLEDINSLLLLIEHAPPEGALYITPSTTME